MAKAVPLPALALEIEARIGQRIRATQPDDPRLRETLLRIGFLIEAEAKLNIRRHGAVDTGRLFNSLRSEIYRQGDRVGVRVGSFGVPYAAINEFGGPFTDRQRRAMFAALRDRGRLGRGVNKGVIKGSYYWARPYLRPAVKTHQRAIMDLLRALFKK